MLLQDNPVARRVHRAVPRLDRDLVDDAWVRLGLRRRRIAFGAVVFAFVNDESGGGLELLP